MTGFTYDGSVTLVDLPADSAGLPDGKAATATLPDRSLLVAAVIDDVTHLWHLSEALDILATTTVSGIDPILIGTDAGAVLVVSVGGAGYTHQVTDGLTVGPAQGIGSAIDPFEFGNFDFMTVAPWVDGDNIYILTRENLDVLTTTGARVAHHTIPETLAIAAHPGAGHALLVDGDAQPWRLGYDGTLTAAGSSSVNTVDYWPITATNPATSWRVTGAGNTTADAVTMNSDGSGVEVYATGDFRAQRGIATTDNAGGALSLTTWLPDTPTKWTRSAYIDHLTPDGISHARVDLGYYADLSGGGTFISQRLGRWVAAAVLTGVNVSPALGARRLVVFTGTVPYHEGILHVDTLSHPWWLVGTRDPGMEWELLCGTPLGWLVEIVAGEESLATHELVVSDGVDWIECALFRPE